MKQLVNLKIGVILMIILSSSCGISASRNRDLQALQEIHNSVDKIDRKVGDPYDVNDLRGCPILVELGMLEKDGRETVWKSNSWESHSGIDLDFDYYKSHEILQNKQKLYNMVYVGPWKYSQKLGKEIRFFAFQKKLNMEIDYQFESKNENNKNIKEIPFNLSKESGFYLPDIRTLCTTKWIAKYGYNAIAEVKYPGFFNGIFKINPVPTGKIIEARE